MTSAPPEAVLAAMNQPSMRCAMKVGWLSEDRYCGRHGREAEWTPRGCPVAVEVADAVWKIADERIRRARDYTRFGRCRTCSAELGKPHQMSCRHYVGPLTHSWAWSLPNRTFSGLDYECTCGGRVRFGGIAPAVTEEKDLVCPNQDQDWRGPR